MSYIFVSYSKKNADYAHHLADTLRAEGFEVWIDRRRLATGDDWWKSIVLALRSCSAFVVIMTPESDGSRWVQREITLAEKYEKPVFPLWLAGDMDTPNWELFVRTQYEDVRGGVLPGAEFYARLEAYAPRQRGSIVAQGQPAVPEQPDNSDGDLEEEIANPPPLNDTLSSPPVSDQPLIPALNPPRRAGPFVFAAALSVIALVMLFFAWSQAGQQANASPTATGTTQVLAQASLEPTATPPSDNATAVYTSTPTPTPTVTITTQSPTSTPTITATPTPTFTITATRTPTPTITAAGTTATLTARTNGDTTLRIVSRNGGVILSSLGYYSGVVLLSRDRKSLQVEVRVSRSGEIGWLLTRALRIEGDVNTLAVNSTPPNIFMATVIGTANVNLRSGPGSEFSVRRILEPGTEVIVLGRNTSTDWLYTDRNTVEGWMSAAVLDVEGNEMLLPRVES